MNTSHFNRSSVLKKLTGFAVLGGALCGFTLSPASAQTLTPTDAAPQSELRPVPGPVSTLR